MKELKILNFKFQKSRGFSLLELLVVIGIISILLAIGFSSYTTVQKKTRDAKRRSDLKALQQAAEQYYSVCGFAYPANLGQAAVMCTTSNPTINLLPTDLLPHDPKTGAFYQCTACGTTSYQICVTPEVEGTICISNQQ